MSIPRTQPQGFQDFRTSVQQEPHPIHVKPVHVTKSESPKQVDHVLQKTHPREMCYRQLSLQQRDEKWNECVIVRRSPLKICPSVEEFEVVQVLEQPDEVYDLPAGPFWFSQGERADGWQEVFKVSSGPRHEARDIQAVNPEFLDAGQREEVAHGKAVGAFLG